MAAAEDFQWLSPRSSVLHRPDALLGPNDPLAQEALLFDLEGKLAPWKFTLSPIFMKLVDELVVNALDASVKDERLRNIRIDFSDGTLTVYNDGMGIPVQKFKDTDRYIPEVIFTELNAGSNFDDVGKRFSGGRNGVGASCANIWSQSFAVEVRDAASGLSFEQRFEDNMGARSVPVVRKAAGRTGHVRVTFRPDYPRLRIDPAQEPALLPLVLTRAQEAALCAARGSVAFNGQRLRGDLRSYARAVLEADAIVDVLGASPLGAGMDVAAAPFPGGRLQAFVNGTRCSDGTHVRSFLDRLAKGLSEVMRQRFRDDVAVRPATLRSQLGLVLVCRIPDPRFTSQAKDVLSTPAKEFGFPLDLPPRLVQRLAKTGLLDALHGLEQTQQLAGALKRTVVPRARDAAVDKYDPALWSRTRPMDCTLLLTEGDSAKAFAVAGLSVLGRERFGVFPLRGVLLNPRGMPVKRALENAEISNLLKILNVSPGSSLETLRYGRIGILTDQDADGSHICGLLINFVSVLLPHLLRAKPDFLERIVTPLVRATRRGTGEVRCFRSVHEFENWARQEDRGSEWTYKYYKGLGTSSAREAKELFAALPGNTVGLQYRGESSDGALSEFFDEGRAEDRKALVVGCDPRVGLDYGQQRAVSIEDFLRLDMVHFSSYHVRRSLPSSIDGLTPARRKVLFYFLQQRDPFAEIKVAQAAPGVAQLTNYLHGENSLVESIVGLAQEHVGTNNVALLEPLGQFGSRLDRPSVHAAARYIFTRLAPVASALFPRGDFPVLERLQEEGQLVEPKHYAPVVPLVLLNGASGIGTGFSCSCPSYAMGDLIAAVRALLEGRALPELRPSWQDFRGAVTLTERSVVTTGLYQLSPDGRSIAITELPVGRWTEVALAHFRSLVDVPAGKSKLRVSSVQNRCTDTDVRIDLELEESAAHLAEADVVSALKLSTSVGLQQMWMFDAESRLVRFPGPEEVLRAHAAERLRLYALRRAHDLGELERRLREVTCKARFVELVIAEQLRFLGRPREEIVADMVGHGLEPDDQGKWDHLLGLPFASATREQVCKLQREAERLREELEALRAETPETLWSADLRRLEEAHARYLEERALRLRGGAAGASSGGHSLVDAPGGAARRRRAPAIAGAPKKKVARK
jgi:DNA topoisomerase-2